MATIPRHDGQGDDEQAWDESLPPSMTRLAGGTRAANEMHAFARAALLNLLRDDPEVAELFEGWTLGTEAGQRCAAFGLAYERVNGLARAAGHDDIAALVDSGSGESVTITADTVEEAERIAAALKDALVECVAREDEAVAALQDVETVGLFDEAMSLVRDRWKLPWPWAAGELFRLWGAWLRYAVLGQKTIITYWVESLEYDQPAPEICFQTRPGESIGSAMQRCLNEVIGPLDAAIEAARIPHGRRSAPKLVEQYVQWWYQRRIRREPWLRIAGGEIDRRTHVKYGVAQAEKWLGASSWGWKDATAP